MRRRPPASGAASSSTPRRPRPGRSRRSCGCPVPGAIRRCSSGSAAGRAELKIFPIPRKGTRRVVLAYTQHVEPAGGVRRYVYPLASRAGCPPIDQASFDVRVVGADAGRWACEPAATTWTRRGQPDESSLAMSRSAFTPQRRSRGRVRDARTAQPRRAPSRSRPRQGPRTASSQSRCDRDSARASPSAAAIRSSSWTRVARCSASACVARRASPGQMVQQMDRRDRVTLLACDLECRSMPGGWHGPGAAAAHDVNAFLAGVEADGASNLVGAVREAALVPGRDGRSQSACRAPVRRGRDGRNARSRLALRPRCPTR